MNENVSGRTVMIQIIKYGVSFLCGDYGVAHVHFFGTRPPLTKEANPLYLYSHGQDLRPHPMQTMCPSKYSGGLLFFC